MNNKTNGKSQIKSYLVRSMTACGAALVFCPGLKAQNDATAVPSTTGTMAPERAHQWDHPGAPNDEGALNRLTTELNLTADQQARIRPVLETYNSDIQSIRQEKGVGREEKWPKFNAAHETEVSGINAVLTPDQRPKFATMVGQMHHRLSEPTPASASTPASAPTRDSMTPKQRLDLLPLPNGVVVEPNVDVSTDPIIAFSKQHVDFAQADPFLMARRDGSVPEHIAIRFTTPMPPREAFLFFIRFFNTEGLKMSDERTLPYYNSRSYLSFDPKNEGDVTTDTKIGDAVFYRIKANAGHGLLDIVIYSLKAADKTTVFIVAGDEK